MVRLGPRQRLAYIRLSRPGRGGLLALWRPPARCRKATPLNLVFSRPPQPKVTTDPKFLINASRRKDVKREA